MARPTTKRPFIPAEHEWLAAVLTTFGGLEGTVFLEVCYQQYGLARLDRAVLSPSDLARRIGSKPPNISRAIKSLLSKRILVRLEDGSYLINEEYSRWELGERAEAHATRIAYCRDAQSLAKSFRRPVDPPRPDPQGQFAFQTAPGTEPALDAASASLTPLPPEHYPARSFGIIPRDNDYYPSGSSTIIPRDNVSLCAYKERPRGIEMNTEKLRVFFRDESAPEVAGEVVKKNEDFSGEVGETAEEWIQKTRALYRGRIDA